MKNQKKLKRVDRVNSIKLGDRFGRLEVIDLPIKEKYWMVECKCDCGNIKKVYVGSLFKETKSCGCLQKEHRENTFKNIVKSTRKENGLDKVKIGDVFGKLTVISEQFSDKRHWQVKCLCECGEEKIVYVSRLLKRENTSCGCSLGNPTHRDCGSKLYSRWSGMLERCYNKNHPSYHRYGGRGIVVFCKWRNNYSEYKKWMLENGYKDELQIDRIDNDFGYFPGNIRFATAKENSNNKENTRQVTAFGETKSLYLWSLDEKCKVSHETLKERFKPGKKLNKRWTVEEIMSLETLPLGRLSPIIEAFGEKKTLEEWVKDSRCKVGKYTLQQRYYSNKKHNKWTNEVMLSTKMLNGKFKSIKRGESNVL